MTKEELLIQRYKCIAPIPFQPAKDMYKVGDIFTDDGKSAVRNQNGDPVYPVEWATYPHLFKQLHWADERKVEDMPEYARITESPMLTKQHLNVGAVVKIHKHYSCSQGTFNAKGCQVFGGDFMSYTKCEPATKEEYEAYLRQKEGKDEVRKL